MRFTTTIIAFALSGVGGVLAEGDFITSCDGSTILVKDRFLTATCSNILGVKKCSKLDLNRCLKNQFGQLVVDSLGIGPGFTDPNQCVGCTNEKPASGGLVIGGGNAPTLMNCKCNPGSGGASAGWPTAYFDLNTLVSNNNGVLECGNTKGTDC